MKIKKELILEKVCQYYKVEPEQVQSINKKRDIVIPRQVYLYLANSLTSGTRESIGKVVNRSHSLVTHTIEKVSNLASIYPDFKNEIELIKVSILTNKSIVVSEVDLLKLIKENRLLSC